MMKEFKDKIMRHELNFERDEISTEYHNEYRIYNGGTHLFPFNFDNGFYRKR